MIDPKELRIGNWVLGSESGNPEKVFALEPGWIHFNCDTLDCVDLDAAHPIPLDKEWLERFGFEKITDAYDLTWAKVKGFEIQWHEENEFWYFAWEDGNTDGYRKRELKYVHQLQNLYFALTGEELEKKLE